MINTRRLQRKLLMGRVHVDYRVLHDQIFSMSLDADIIAYVKNLIRNFQDLIISSSYIGRNTNRYPTSANPKADTSWQKIKTYKMQFHF